MLNRLLVLSLAPHDSLLRRYTASQAPRVPYHHREFMLDELDAMIAKERKLHNMDNVHALLDTAHWVSNWPLQDIVMLEASNE